MKNHRDFFINTWSCVLNFWLMIESILFPIFSKVIRRWLNNMAAADEWSCQALKTTPGSLIKILILRLSYHHHLISRVSRIYTFIFQVVRFHVKIVTMWPLLCMLHIVSHVPFIEGHFDKGIDYFSVKTTLGCYDFITCVNSPNSGSLQTSWRRHVGTFSWFTLFSAVRWNTHFTLLENHVKVSLSK